MIDNFFAYLYIPNIRTINIPLYQWCNLPTPKYKDEN